MEKRIKKGKLIMIKNVKNVNGQLTWCNENNQYQQVIAGGTYVNDSDHILIMNEERDIVIVVDEKGNQVTKLCNSDSIYLMYLVTHPRFGLSVAASIKDKDGNWKDKHLQFIHNGFEIVSNVR